MIFWIKLRQNLKRLLSYLKSAPSNLSNVMYHVKQKMPYLGTLRPEFEKKNIAVFEITTLKFVKMQSFKLKKKKIKCWTKTFIFGKFWTET